MKRVIKNDVVKMVWNADCFYESRKRGFIAAVNVYDTVNGAVPVVFQDKVAFILIDTDTGKPACIEDIGNVIKDCFKEDLDISDALEDSYIELGVGFVTEEDIAEMYGLSEEDISDINDRIDDLMPYWELIETPMS